MVKTESRAIKAEGADKAYTEIDDPSGTSTDRDLYIVTYGLDGLVLVHGIDAQIDDKDADGKSFVEVRDCQRLNETAGCGGAYQ
jgi:hypothetical protein